MLGSNTILLFKYPLLKRKLNLLKSQIRDMPGNCLTEDEIDDQAKI